ncbi:sensor histidine kinase [Lentilactobacillus parafarraginis]|jgi:two-component system sensor histidine kinase NreB|uniref:Sensor histidine kinase n=1 Tax=Lentilactobacillus parafarraginis TaxID=390842 RepID=A0A5R9CWX3_9LACO|nr:sensor histidine kinase [Lentilactobacillus parafarraginis]TLQ20275.1 sensor histidine kinase [Lentilactobacillus parafarraginis]
MSKSQDWIHQYFDDATDATWIFQNHQPIVSNHLAQKLHTKFAVDPQYLMAIAQAAVSENQSQINDCYNCTIKNHMTTITIPITLPQQHDHVLKYFMIYHQLDSNENVTAITLKSRGTLKRVDQLAQQRQLNQYVNRAHEKERKRISQDLHDSIAQGVYSAIMGVRRLGEKGIPTDERSELTHEIERQLNDVLKEVKEMALDIRPSVLDNFGLLPALRVLAKRLTENTGVTIHTVGACTTDHLSQDVQSVLYRIGQEAISNALRHAEAREINVLLVTHDYYVTLEIIDDGHGFDVPKQQHFNGHSLGLMNMNERVKALNGTFEIHSKLGSGTTVSAKFPIQQRS